MSSAIGHGQQRVFTRAGIPTPEHLFLHQEFTHAHHLGWREQVVHGFFAIAHPFAVDTASGTETRPGVKDPEKLRAFAAAVDATAPAVAEPA